MEISDLNLEFLGLVVSGRGACLGPVFGLERAIVERIGTLRDAQIEAIAATPCLLARVEFDAAHRLSRLAEPQPPPDAGWAEETRLFAARLITYAWQVARRDPLHALLCVGQAGDSRYAPVTCSELRHVSRRPTHQVLARFHDHPSFWPGLVRAARNGLSNEVQLARLAVIPLATVEMSAAGDARLA